MKTKTDKYQPVTVPVPYTGHLPARESKNVKAVGSMTARFISCRHECRLYGAGMSSTWNTPGDARRVINGMQGWRRYALEAACKKEFLKDFWGAAGRYGVAEAGLT